jgi:hypothetical protein
VMRSSLVLLLAGAAASCRATPASPSAPAVPTAPIPAASAAPSVSASASPPAVAPVVPVSAVPLDSGLFAAAEAEAPAVVRDLERLVNIDSGTGDAGGLGKVGAFLVARLRELGAKVETTSAAPSAGSSVTGTLRGKGTRDLLLMIHVDTVFAPGEAARRPFRREGNRAFGPGVADAKGGVAIILLRLRLRSGVALRAIGRSRSCSIQMRRRGRLGRAS